MSMGSGRATALSAPDHARRRAVPPPHRDKYSKACPSRRRINPPVPKDSSPSMKKKVKPPAVKTVPQTSGRAKIEAAWRQNETSEYVKPAPKGKKNVKPVQRHIRPSRRKTVEQTPSNSVRFSRKKQVAAPAHQPSPTGKKSTEYSWRHLSPSSGAQTGSPSRKKNFKPKTHLKISGGYVTADSPPASVHRKKAFQKVASPTATHMQSRKRAIKPAWQSSKAPWEK